MIIQNGTITGVDYDITLTNYDKRDVVFFDIETTGFSSKSTFLYLIGALYYDKNTWRYIQWFSDTVESEAIVLSSFFEFIQEFKAVIHYNGDGFDIPYLLYKCKHYNLPYNFDNHTSIDLLKEAKSLKKILKLENYKQKTVEQFLGINRDDLYSGGELIDVYKHYIAFKEVKDFDLLLLHNHDDIIAMPRILQLFSYSSLINGDFSFDSYEITTNDDFSGMSSKDITVILKLNSPLAKRVSIGNAFAYLSAYASTAKIRIKMYTGELKYFYQDYKNYFYLPEEDVAIHKSVAFYVDKNYRTKAKAANCYSKKTGMFLPQTKDIFTPYFKIEYADKLMYFEATDDFFNSTDNILLYIKEIISALTV